MDYGAWKSDAVHHKGFCGNTSLKHVAKELPVGKRVALEYKDTNGTQKKLLTAMRLIFCQDQFALALEELSPCRIGDTTTY